MDLLISTIPVLIFLAYALSLFAAAVCLIQKPRNDVKKQWLTVLGLNIVLWGMVWLNIQQGYRADANLTHFDGWPLIVFAFVLLVTTAYQFIIYRAKRHLRSNIYKT